MTSPVLPSGAAAPPPANERARLHQAAQAFEAVFVRQMLASARSADFGDRLWGQDAGHDTFAQMRDDRMADVMARSGSIGLAQRIEAQLAANLKGGGQ